MSIEISMGVDWDIDSEILDWADADDGWRESDLYADYTVVGDVLEHCPSVSVDGEFFEAGPLSHVAYIVSTDDPVQARKEIRDQVARMIREWRRKEQAVPDFGALTMSRPGSVGRTMRYRGNYRK